MTAYESQTILEKLLILHPDREWNWFAISQNPNITMEMIEAHPDKPWNWSWISINLNITMKMINSLSQFF